MPAGALCILIIDDSPEDRGAYTHWLRRLDTQGYALAEAETGRQGLTLLKALRPDCVLLDYRLPDMTGLAWLERSGPDRTLAQVPVLMLTGYNQENLGIAAIQAGADDYLVKYDLTPDRLHFSIRRAIAHARARRAHDEAQARLESVLATAPVGIALLDTQLRYLQINEQMAAINSLPLDAHLGRTIDEIVPSIAPLMTPLMREALATGQAFRDLEINCGTPGTSTSRSYLVSCYPVSTPVGQMIGVGAIVVDITDRKRAEDELRASSEQLQVLSRHLVEAHERERRHIARELHDEVGQVLTGLKLTLGVASTTAPPPLATTLADACEAINELLGRVRTLSLDLRPALLDDLGLLPALGWYLERYTSRTGVQVSLRHQGVSRRFPPEVETVAYRTIQEALTNVARHAGVSTATVRLLADHTHLMLRIDDAGRGFDAEAMLATHATGGLSGMEERVQLIGGVLTIESAPEEGTRIIVELPLAAGEVGR